RPGARAALRTIPRRPIRGSGYRSQAGASALADPEGREHVGAPCGRSRGDLAKQAPAMAVHADEQRSEIPHAELPEGFRIDVVEVDVLDRLDPGRLERRGAADDRE